MYVIPQTSMVQGLLVIVLTYWMVQKYKQPSFFRAFMKR